MFVEPTAYDVSGELVAAFHSAFSTTAAASEAVAWSASITSIDVRFAGHAPASIDRAYLYTGRKRVPAQVEVIGVDLLHMTPAAPLEAGQDYQLVIDAFHEIAIHVEDAPDEAPLLLTSERTPGGIHLRFSQPINPLTLHGGALRVAQLDGTSVPFSTSISLDGKELIVVPARSTGPLTVTLDGVASRFGARFPYQARQM